jgi:hypothetical protein
VCMTISMEVILRMRASQIAQQSPDACHDMFDTYCDHAQADRDRILICDAEFAGAGSGQISPIERKPCRRLRRSYRLRLECGMYVLPESGLPWAPARFRRRLELVYHSGGLPVGAVEVQRREADDGWCQVCATSLDLPLNKVQPLEVDSIHHPFGVCLMHRDSAENASLGHLRSASLSKPARCLLRYGCLLHSLLGRLVTSGYNRH